jgi:hypothetical protein
MSLGEFYNELKGWQTGIHKKARCHMVKTWPDLAADWPEIAKRVGTDFAISI